MSQPDLEARITALERRVRAAEDEVAIRNLTQFCETEGIDSIEGRVMSAMDIDQLGPQDLVYGSLILHHLEPFDRFARTLRAAIRPGGKGYFYENNAASRTMVWFRRHVVGKLWVPKHGDDDEFPLEPHEVDELRKHFTVEQSFPELASVTVPFTEPATGSVVAARFSRSEARARRVANEARLGRRLGELRGVGLEPLVVGTSDPLEIDREFLAWAELRRQGRRRAR